MQKITLYIFILLFSFGITAQNHFRDQLDFERIHTLQSPLNFMSAYEIKAFVDGNRVVLIGRNPDLNHGKKIRAYPAILIDLEKGTEDPFTVELASSQLRKNGEKISSGSFHDKHLFLNFWESQFLFEINKGKVALIEEFAHHDISGSVYATADEYRIARNSKYDRRDSDNENYFAIHPLKDNKQKELKHALHLQGVALNDMNPSKIVAFEKDWVAWVEPINHDLFFYHIPSQAKSELKYEGKNWKRIPDDLLKDITDKKKAADDLIYTLREVVETSSRVWKIEFIDPNTLASFYHHPTDSGFKFFSNIYRLKNEKWELDLQATEMALSNWKGFSQPLNKANFPFAYFFINTSPIFTQDYACLLIEQNSEEFEGKAFEEFFETIPTKNNKLRMHIFKHTLSE